MNYPPLEKSPHNKKFTECLYCGTPGTFYWHHVFGASNKKHSEKYGAVVYPCPICHTWATDSIHKQASQEKNFALKSHYRDEILKEYDMTIEEFKDIFGKTWL